MRLIRTCNLSNIREEIPAAVSRSGAWRRDGFIRRGALDPAARAL